MKRVVVKLVFDTFEYVIQQYYPEGRRKWWSGQILILLFLSRIPIPEN